MTAKPEAHGSLKERDRDMVNAEVALKRAALRAREKAKGVGRGVFIWKDNRVVEDRSD